MVKKVVSITGQPVVGADGPNQDLTDSIESLLERAKSGEFVGGAYAMVKADGRIMTEWDDADHLISGYSLTAAVAMLQHRMLTQLNDED